MLEPAISACLREGFHACDAWRVKGERWDFREGPDGRQSLEGTIDRLAVRAFWETGDPVGFSLSAPTAKDIREAAGEIKASVRPGRTPNFAEALPQSMAMAVHLQIEDPRFSSGSDEIFSALSEKCREIQVSLPGLKLDDISLSGERRRVSIANSRGLTAHYTKTLFSLRLHLVWKGHCLEIAESKSFLSHLNPERLISRAYNLLQSLARRGGSCPPARYLVLSPEAVTAVLREFAVHFRLGGPMPKPNQWLGAAGITLADHPLLDGQPGSAPFDDEGVAAGETMIINKGVFAAPVSNIQTAVAAGKHSSGNGWRGENDIFPGVRFSNLFLKPSPFSLAQMMREAGNGILVSMMRQKDVHPGRDERLFSAYGFSFVGEDTADPVHLYVKTGFRSFWPRVLRLSKELRFFHQRYSIGSPYVLVEASVDSDGCLVI